MRWLILAIGLSVACDQLVGPQGPQGPRGDTGDQGPAGPIGDPGLDGAANLDVVEFTFANSLFTIAADGLSAWYAESVPQITQAVVDDGTVITQWGSDDGLAWFALPVTWTNISGNVTLTYVYYAGGIEIQYWTSYTITGFNDGVTGPFKVVIIPPVSP